MLYCNFPPTLAVPAVSHFQRGIPRDLPSLPRQHHPLLPGNQIREFCHTCFDGNDSPFVHTWNSQADTPWLDNAADETVGFSAITQFADILKNGMNPACAANAISMLCHSTFRECGQIADRTTSSPVWLPSLLCRSECERHGEIWNSCLATEDDLEAKDNFDTQMMSLVRHPLES